MESTETISTSPSCCAARSDSADFPEAVWPTSARCRVETRGTSANRHRDAGSMAGCGCDRNKLAAEIVRSGAGDGHVRERTGSRHEVADEMHELVLAAGSLRRTRLPPWTGLGQDPPPQAH